MTKLFDVLKTGFEEAIAHDQGKIKLDSVLIAVPNQPEQQKIKNKKKKGLKKVR